MDTTNENGQVVKHETVEIIDNGKTLNSGSSALASIFDKIEAGKEDGLSAKEVLKDEGKVVEKPAEKQAEKPVEKKPEPVAEKPVDQEKKEEKKEVEEDARESLRKAFDEKATTKAEKKEDKGTQKVDKAEDDVSEDELKVLPQDKPKTAKRIQALLKRSESLAGETAKTKAEKEALAKERDELAEKLKTVKTVDPKTEEEVKKQLDELAMYRRRYELDKDPEVKTKFDARVESAEAAITETLVKRNAGKPLLDLIKEEGGWSKFSESNRIVTVPDGEGGTKQVTAAELAEIVLQALPLSDRKNVEAAMVEQVQTRRDKTRFLKEEESKAAEYFKKRDEEGQRATAEQQKQVEEARKTIEEYKAKTLSSDWIKDKEIPANASPAEKAATEEHNKYNAQLRQVFNKAIGTKSLNELLEVVTDSVKYYDERRTSASLRKEVDRLKAEVAAKQAEMDKYRGAGRSVAKSGSISISPAKINPEDDRPASLEDAFARLERGESLPARRRGGEDE